MRSTKGRASEVRECRENCSLQLRDHSLKRHSRIEDVTGSEKGYSRGLPDDPGVLPHLTGTCQSLVEAGRGLAKLVFRRGSHPLDRRISYVSRPSILGRYYFVRAETGF